MSSMVSSSFLEHSNSILHLFNRQLKTHLFQH